MLHLQLHAVCLWDLNHNFTVIVAAYTITVFRQLNSGVGGCEESMSECLCGLTLGVFCIFRWLIPSQLRSVVTRVSCLCAVVISHLHFLRSAFFPSFLSLLWEHRHGYSNSCPFVCLLMCASLFNLDCLFIPNF